MSIAFVIAITPAEREWLLRIVRYSDEYVAGREPATGVAELLQSAMTAKEARMALIEIGEPD